MFGDIIAIYSGETKLVEYAYDAFGNCTIVSDTGDIGFGNPFRYRGYYWDNDLQLYYLMSRYYDPVTGRFINADTLDYLEPESINGLNLYAYCYNNPIMYADPSGHSVVLIGLIVGAILGFATAAYIDYADDGEIFNGSVAWYDYLGATVVGGAIGAGLGYFAGMSFSATIPTIGFINTGGALAVGVTGAITITVTGAEVLAAAGLLGILLFAKGSGPRMGHNQHEKQMWNEAMRQLNITDKDLIQRLHHKVHKYPYQDTLEGLIKILKEILRSIGK